MWSRALVALVVVVLAASGATCAGDATQPPPPPPLWTGNALGLFQMWRNAWMAGAARANAAAAAAASSSTKNQKLIVENDTSRSPQAATPASLLDVVATVARNDTAAGYYGHSLMSSLGSCVVDVAKLRLDASTFEASCPGKEAEKSTTTEDHNYDFASCGTTCGCELGRRLQLAGYSVIGPDAVDLEVRFYSCI